TLGTVHEVLVLAGELRVALDLLAQLAELALDIVINLLLLGAGADFRGVGGRVAIALWVVVIPAGPRAAATVHRSTGAAAVIAATALRTASATRLVAGLLALSLSLSLAL